MTSENLDRIVAHLLTDRVTDEHVDAVVRGTDLRITAHNAPSESGPRRWFVRPTRTLLVAAIATLTIASVAGAIGTDLRSLAGNLGAFGDRPSSEESSSTPTDHERELAGPGGVPDQFGSLRATVTGQTLLSVKDDRWTARVWAATTTKDNVCFYVSSSRSGGPIGSRSGTCATSVPSNFPVILLTSLSNGYVEVAGIFTDDVVDVTVEGPDGNVETQLGRNAFYWGAPAPGFDPTHITLRLDDGTTLSRAIGSIDDFREAEERSRLASKCAHKDHPESAESCRLLHQPRT